jgi:hypothetical protein
MSNGRIVVRKLPKKPPPKPWLLPKFSPLQIDNWYDLGEASVSSSLERHDPMAIFQLFFTPETEMMEKMVLWTNEYALYRQPTDVRRRRPWKPATKQELATLM